MKNLLRLLLAAVILLWQATAHARPRSTVEMMEELNSISLLKPFYQIRIFVNDDLSGAENLTIDQSGNIFSKYAGRLRAAGRSSKQLAHKIRGIIQQGHPTDVQLPDLARRDPLVRVSVIGILNKSHPMNKSHPIEPLDILQIWKEEQPQSKITQKVAVTGEIFAYKELTQVAGLNVQQVEGSLSQQHGASIIVRAFHKKTVPQQQYTFPTPWSCPTAIVFGKATFQGKYWLNPAHENRVSELIKLAGGFSKKTLPVVQIVRATPQGSKYILLNAKAIWEDNKSEYDLFVRPNDVIIVK